MSSSFVTDEIPATDFESITVSNVSIGFTASKILQNETGGFKRHCTKALFTVETNSIRFRLDGTAPTATVGHLMAAGDSFLVTGDTNITNLRLIRQSADATVMVTYFFNR